MKRKIYTKIERSLYAFVMLLLSMLSQDQHTRTSRQVNGNILNSSPSTNISSLPNLTERANVNSRHLSASSTASLAAAQMAASNSGGGGGVSQTNSQVNSQVDPNRAYLTHQQHQQQHLQQQQQQQQQSSQNVNNQQQIGATSSSSISVAPQQQQQQQQQQVQPAPQFNSVQPQQVGGGSPALAASSPSLTQGAVTPVMSTTFTFNPQTGQYQATDLSAALSPGFISGPGLASGGQQQQQQVLPFNQFNGNPFGNANSNFNGNQQQQQQYNPFKQPAAFNNQQQQQFDLANRYPAATVTNNQFSQASNFNNLPNNLNQFVNQQRQVSQFLRRNGGNSNNNIVSGNSLRFNTNLFGQPPSQTIDDEINGIYQQQQQQQQLGPDLNQYGGVFDSSIYGNYLPYSTNNNNNNQGGIPSFDSSLISPQPSSIAPVVQLPSGPTSSSSPSSLPTSFNQAIQSSSSTEYNHRNELQCVAADNRHGTCYQASECIRRGGTPMGKCGSVSSSELSGSSYVCCLFDVSCGQFAAERFVYFRNPNYPNTYDQSRMCRAKIGKLDKGICQYRLDLLHFDVAKPTNGNCSQDMFVVSGQNENYIIPKICGLNDNQHYYVGVDESGVITLHMMMMGFYRRSFEIMITQIPCRSDYAAPAHCLQYYMGTHGTIKSFNYDDNDQQLQSNNYDLLPQAAVASSDYAFNSNGNSGPMAPYGMLFNASPQQQRLHHHQQHQHQYHHHQLASAAALNGNGLLANVYQSSSTSGGDFFGGYPNDLDYTMCIRKESGFCSITYQLSRSDQGLQPFAVGYQQAFGGGLQNDTYSTNQWHPVSTECRDDYLLIGGVRLCSGGAGSNSFKANGAPFDGSGASIQFAQNGTILNAAGIGNSNGQQLQQLQNQQNLLLHQLARLQQQQSASQSPLLSSNVSYANGNQQVTPANANQAQIGQQQQQQQNLAQNGPNQAVNNNLDQQQAAIMQQLLLVQQQMNLLTSNQGQAQQQQQQQQYGNRHFSSSLAGLNAADLQDAIITDTTSGPFLLRFVSNLARNARGFHIDYRQNPCK